jgi:hypothetical protein
MNTNEDQNRICKRLQTRGDYPPRSKKTSKAFEAAPVSPRSLLHNDSLGKIRSCQLAHFYGKPDALSGETAR